MLRLKDYEHHSNEYVARKRLEAIKGDLLRHIEFYKDKIQPKINFSKINFSKDKIPRFAYFLTENEILEIKELILKLENEVTEINLMLL